MAVVTQNDARRHRLARWSDGVVAVMACGLRVAMIGGPCPETTEHRVAMPGCRNHERATACRVCGAA